MEKKSKIDVKESTDSEATKMVRWWTEEQFLREIGCRVLDGPQTAAGCEPDPSSAYNQTMGGSYNEAAVINTTNVWLDWGWRKNG